MKIIAALKSSCNLLNDNLIALFVRVRQTMTLSVTQDNDDTIPFDGLNVSHADPIQEAATDAPTKSPKKIEELTKRDLELIRIGAKIAQTDPRKSDQLVYMHTIMCQLGLPRSAVKGLEFERVCGGAGMYVTAGKLWDGTKFIQQPIPFGSYPRLVLAHINTLALLQKSPEVNVEASATQFLKRIGKRSSGGKKGTHAIFQGHIAALAACNITVGLNTANSAITYDGKPINKLEAWLPAREGEAIKPNIITLSHEYYETLKSHAIPLDMRALNALAPSALAMDIYMMLAERLHRISGRPVVLYWKNLREQFGQEYTGKDAIRSFKKSFRSALRDALAVYPWAKVNEVKGGILMFESKPPVPYKPTAYGTEFELS